MSPTATLRTRVIFRLFKGEVLALFPGLAANRASASMNPDFCLCYDARDKHCTAHYFAVMRQSRKATPAEHASLERELRRAGYALEIVTRATPADWRARCQTCQPEHAALSAK